VVDYCGPATLTVDERDVPVYAVLDARHEPYDGRLHWFGRITPAAGELQLKPTSEAELRTATGRAMAHVGDLDPWGRYQVKGVGQPPY
jgi:hypothetical protein